MRHLRRSVTGAPVPVIPGNAESGAQISAVRGFHRSPLAETLSPDWLSHSLCVYMTYQPLKITFVNVIAPQNTLGTASIILHQTSPEIFYHKFENCQCFSGILREYAGRRKTPPQPKLQRCSYQIRDSSQVFISARPSSVNGKVLSPSISLFS